MIRKSSRSRCVFCSAVSLVLLCFFVRSPRSLFCLSSLSPFCFASLAYLLNSHAFYSLASDQREKFSRSLLMTRRGKTRGCRRKGWRPRFLRPSSLAPQLDQSTFGPYPSSLLTKPTPDLPFSPTRNDWRTQNLPFVG